MKKLNLKSLLNEKEEMIKPGYYQINNSEDGTRWHPLPVFVKITKKMVGREALVKALKKAGLDWKAPGFYELFKATLPKTITI